MTLFMMKRFLIASLLVLAAASTLVAQPKDAPLNPQLQDANWIWLAGFEETPDTSIYFRKVVSIDAAPTHAVMQITCDNAYKVWINGVFAAETLNPGPESWRVADAYDVSRLLKAGENYIAIQGTNQQGKGALLMQIKYRTADGVEGGFSSDASWEAASEPGDAWHVPGATGGNWQPVLDYGRAATTAPWFYPRPPSNLLEHIRRAKVDMNRRVVMPVSVKVEPATTAEVTGLDTSGTAVNGQSLGQIKITSRQPGEKLVLMCDFGRESVGHPLLIGSSVNGAKVSVTCGEYENECNAPYQPVISAQFERGAIRWLTPERRAFRYVRFEIEPNKMVQIDRIQAQLLEYPVQRSGSFECSDDMLNKIWDTSVHTLHLCMQDYYEDGIKRDKLLWTGDLRVEALVGYYAFNASALPRKGLMQLADIQLPDGLIPGVGPAANSTYLPDYCAYWVMTLADYYRYTGDHSTVELLYPYVQKVMEWFKANSDETELFRNADRAGWWMFVDWDDSIEKKDRVMALEALYYQALKDAAELATATYNKGDANTFKQRATQLQQAINSTMWSAEQGAYVDCVTDEGPSKLIHKQPNSLALLAGLPDAEMAAKVVEAILDNARTPAVTTPYMNFYVTSALFENGRGKEALEFMRSYWGAMIERGATSFWEKFDPNWPTPYEQADLSYCHGWSAGPGMMLPAYVAGIRPIKPGFEHALVAPEIGTLEWAKAEVPTPLGKIKVDWKADRGVPVGTVDIPRNCVVTLSLPAPPEGFGYTIDGKLRRFRQADGKFSLELKGSNVYTVGLQETGKR